MQRADAREIVALDADRLPAELLGLQVKREDISEVLDGSKRPYLDEAGLYSLREGETLQATLQVGRFADGVDHDDTKFREKLLTTVGGGSIRELRLGDRQVYLTTGDRQQVALWFLDSYLMVLSTREEYQTPRALLPRHAGAPAMTRSRWGRSAALLIVVAVGLLASGCAKNENDSEEVRRLVDATAPNSFRFIYEVDHGGTSHRVQGLIEDDLRYKVQLSVDGRPALEQVVVDDAVAVRFLAPGLVETFIDAENRDRVELASSVSGATVLDALKAQRWVVDPIGAPSLLLSARDSGNRDEEGTSSDDPIFDARTVLAYVRTVANSQPMVRYDPESLEPTYRSDEDPFLAPEDGSGVTRYDTVVFPLPRAGEAGGGTGASFPGYLNMRRLAVYAEGGKIISVREHTQLTTRQVRDLSKYIGVVLEETAPKAVVDDFERTLRQLPAGKVPQFLLDGVNAFRDSSGQEAVTFRNMAVEIQDLGDPSIRVALPADDVITGSLAVLRNMGRKPVKAADDADNGSSGGVGGTRPAASDG